MKNFLRIGATTALLGAALSANALTLHFQSSGGGASSGYASTSTSLIVGTTNVTLPDPSVTAGTFVNLVLKQTKGAGIPLIPGSYTFGGTGVLVLTTGLVKFSVVNGFGAPSGPAGLYTSNQAQAVNFYNGTGIFAGLTGTGVVSFNTTKKGTRTTGEDVGDVTVNFDATFEAVPEPASMAVLGLGVVALLRRCKRA